MSELEGNVFMKNESVVLFTSCDENYIKHIPTLLMSVQENMPTYSVEFYFLYTSIGQDQIEKLRKLCDKN